MARRGKGWSGICVPEANMWPSVLRQLSHRWCVERFHFGLHHLGFDFLLLLLLLLLLKGKSVMITHGYPV